MNWGCRLAVVEIVLNVVVGRSKQRDCGFEAWRKRQRAEISFVGRAAVLGTSRKE